MGIACFERDEAIAISLEGVVDIVYAADLKTSLLHALSSGKPLRLSLDQCADLDTTAFQLLWAAAREAKSQSISFTLDTPVPSTILSSLKDVGFESFPVSA